MTLAILLITSISSFLLLIFAISCLVCINRGRDANRHNINLVLKRIDDFSTCLSTETQHIDSLSVELKQLFSSINRSTGEMRATIDTLQTSMKTAMMGINKNIKNVFDSLLTAVKENDPVRLSQVVRAAKVLTENFDTINCAFDDYVFNVSVDTRPTKKKKKSSHSIQLPEITVET